jgi:hypothetical protein
MKRLLRLQPWAYLLLLSPLLCLPLPAAPTNSNSIIAPPRLNVPGKHIALPSGTLFVPHFFILPANGKADLVVFFLGAAWCAEQNFYAARKNAVLLTVTGTEMTRLSENKSQLTTLLAQTRQALATNGIPARAIGRICLASFSGGYVAPRTILRQTNFLDQISDVVLADSLYAPRLAKATNQLDPAAMSPFLNYARRAAVGQGHFFFSHLYPPEMIYRSNTTTLAASYLIDRLQVERRPAHSTNSRNAKLLYRADKGNFHVLGYAGMNNQDHFNHFYGVSDLLRETSLDPIE